ncbi:MAG: SprB repeat-containing protein [Saprospiraceae bacterium]|nr:SprB repeat-containing protein [Saprospiraceae bacterium]
MAATYSNANGSAAVTVTGGTPAYQYLWDNAPLLRGNYIECCCGRLHRRYHRWKWPALLLALSP